MVGLCEAKKKAEMRDSIWEAGEKGVLLVKKWQKMHKKNKKMTKKVLYLTADCADFADLTAFCSRRVGAKIVNCGLVKAA